MMQENEKMLTLLLYANIPVEALFPGGSIIELIRPSDTYRERYRKLAEEASFYKILLVWFQEGMKESPEEMADICSTFLRLS